MPLFGRPTPQDDDRAAAWRDWFGQRNPLAVASLVLGVFSLIEFGAIPLFSVGSIVLGVAALAQLRSTRSGRSMGHRLAWVGIILGCLSLGISMVIYSLPRVHE